VVAEYVPSEPRDDVNLPLANPLRELVVLLAGVFGLAVALFFVLGSAVQLLVPYVPVETEVALLSAWGPELVEELGAEDERRDQLVELLERLATHWPDNPYEIRLGVMPAPEINAVALPGGAILVTSEALDELDEQAIAFILAHELGHFHNRDHLRALGRTLSFKLAMATFGLDFAQAEGLMRHLEQAAGRSFDRTQELDADRFAAALLAAEYGHIGGVVTVLERLGEETDESRWLGYLSSHPASDDRIEEVRAQAAAAGWSLGQR